MDTKWKYYNHAMLPTLAPHEDVDIKPIIDGSIWHFRGGMPLLVRWTTEFDCGYETEWYYCIKDTPFILQEIKSKYRYDINKGRKHFNVFPIIPKEKVKEIYEIQVEAFKSYPREYRPQISFNDLEKEIYTKWDNKIVFGAFDIETNRMVSYCTFEKRASYIEWSVLKSIPQYERLKVNAAIISYSLEYFNEAIIQGYYVHGGERNISHETTFQEYLERTFGFRKAYCKVHVVYRPCIKIIVDILYPFRGILSKIHNRLFHNINAILKMETICRSQKV